MPRVRVYSPVQLLDMALEYIHIKKFKTARNTVEKAISLTNTGYGDAFYETSVGYVLDDESPAELIEASIHLLEASYFFQVINPEKHVRYVRRAGVYLRHAVELLDVELEGVSVDAA